MAETKEVGFTPGPWEVGGYSDINGNYLHIGAKTSMTVLASMNDTHPATVANARLIAASPTMLEALREVEEYMDQRADADQPAGCASPIPNEEMKLLVIIRNALSKATEAANGK